MEFLGSIFEIRKNALEATGKWVLNINSLDAYMKNLKRKIEYLSCQEDDINTELSSAERSLKRQKKEVEVWLGDVKTLKGDVRTLQRLEEEVVGWKYVFSCARLGKLVMEKIQEVEELQVKGRFSNGLRLMHYQLVDGPDQQWDLLSDIAKALNLDFSDYEDESRIASELYAILSRKERYVLILDDLWEAFPMEKVGIPEPIRSNGCKLVLSLRFFEVCKKMACRPVKVELLTEEEALNLFMSKVEEGQTVLIPEVKEIARKVAKECTGLPLAIVTLAGSMRGVNDIHEWRNTLNQLISSTKQISDIENVVFELLKFCYSCLKDEKLQYCFLYYALYPQDHIIPRKELIEYWISKGLIAEVNSIEAMFNNDTGFVQLLHTVSARVHLQLGEFACTLTSELCMLRVCAVTGELKALKELKLSRSPIREVLQGMEELVNLRNLDLSFNKNLHMLPCWTLCRLSQLQILRIELSGAFVSAQEVFGYLRQLKVLGAQSLNVQKLASFVTSQQCQTLENYRLIVGNNFEYINNSVGKEVHAISFGSGVDSLVLPSNIE
ncbi:putative disease resistance protein [Camellia lanceoleosa]|uniref:Disease resistance protein n=1 Tax=Camellia lanceoleosa TaxID=1840588 RepID=A0ACC0IRL0_9ERIC|nr:putative disease resistance protein [Camellia lanceoleosa]